MGAIGNGLELMQMSKGGDSAELDLIKSSLASALAKLRFFRLAFGPVDAQVRQSFEEAADVTDAMFRGRFSVTWAGEGRDMPRTTARMIYLAILCLERSLPTGGSALVTVSGDSVALTVKDRRTAPPADLWALVTSGAPTPDLRADGVQFALLRQALADDGQRIDAAFTETGAQLRITAAARVAA